MNNLRIAFSAPSLPPHLHRLTDTHTIPCTCTASLLPHCFARTCTTSHAPAPCLHNPTPTCHTSAPLPTSMTCLTIGPAEQHEARRVQQKLTRARLQGSRCQTVQIRHISIQVSSQTLQQPTSSFAITQSSKKAELSGIRVRTKPPRQTRSLPHLLGQTPTPYRLLPSHRNMEWDEIVMFPDLERQNPQHTRHGHLLRLAATQLVLRHVWETRA